MLAITVIAVIICQNRMSVLLPNVSAVTEHQCCYQQEMLYNFVTGFVIFHQFSHRFTDFSYFNRFKVLLGKESDHFNFIMFEKC